jgi:ankyrin repeat protein
MVDVVVAAPLVDAGAWAGNWEVLQWAANHGHARVAAAALAAGADVEQVGADGLTALMWAADHSCAAVLCCWSVGAARQILGLHLSQVHSQVHDM